MALGAVIFGGREFYAAAQARQGGVALEREAEALKGQRLAVERRLKTETERVAAIESDNVTLGEAMQKAKTVKKPLAENFTLEALDQRLKAVLALAGERRDDETAARELWWCFEAVRNPRTAITPAQLSKVAAALAEIGERQPAVMAQLRAKTEKARERALSSPNDSEAIPEVSQLSKAIKDDHVMLALLDALPPGDPRRSTVAIYAFDELLDARRYQDALWGPGYGFMSAVLERGVAQGGSSTMRQTTVEATGKNIEVLAGTGDLDHARDLAKRLLAFDGSDETRAMLQARLVRAGQPDLLK